MAVAVLHDKRTISAKGKTSKEINQKVITLTSMDHAAKIDEKKAKNPVASAETTLAEA